MTARFLYRVFSIKYLVFIFLLTILYLLLTTSTYAQQVATPSAISHEPLASYAPLPAYVSPQSPTYANLMVFNIMHAFFCVGVGQSPIGPCVDYQLSKDMQGNLKTVPVLSSVNTSGGLLGVTGSLLTAMYVNQPLRTSDYLGYLGRGFGIVPEAHAQVGGSGSGVLSPVLALWQVSANLSYLFMIIIFIIIGLMVMFRQRLNPQTVVSVQLALPGLVIGLILITLSYFLAGLISDMAFVGTNLVGYYFVSAQNPVPAGTSTCPNPVNLVDCTKSENVLSIFARYTKIINSDEVTDALRSIWDYFDSGPISTQSLLTGLATFFTANLFSQNTEFLKAIPTWGAVIQGVVTGIAAISVAKNPTYFIGLTLYFIAIFILIYSMFKLLLRLINNFLTIIFLTISAPFQFLVASLPGRQGIATDWMLNMLCNVLAFPAVIAVFYFVAFLLRKTDVPPLVISTGTSLTSGAAFPLFGGLQLKFINTLVAFGALVATPAIPDIICRAIGKASQAGQLIGQEIQAGVRGGQGYSSQYQQGLAGASRSGAGARGLFGTVAYQPTAFDPVTGQPTKWTINPVSYQPNALQKLQAHRYVAAQQRSGGFKLGQ